MNRFFAELLYTTEHLPKWKKFLYLLLAIIFTIGSVFISIFFRNVLLFFIFILSFMFCFFSGRIYSLLLFQGLDYKYKFKKYTFDECEQRRGFSFSFLKPKHFISAAKYIENSKNEKEDAKKQISYFIAFLNNTNNFSVTLCDANKIAKYGTTDERDGISIYFKIFVVFISSFFPILLETFENISFHPWYFFALCFIIYFLGQHFWFCFGIYHPGITYVRNTEYENLTDKIISKDVVGNYITDPRSCLYCPTDREDVYATYSRLDFSKIVEIFSLDDSEIDFLCKRLIEIDYLRLKEQTRQDSFYYYYVMFTNFLFHNSILFFIFSLFSLK